MSLKTLFVVYDNGSYDHHFPMGIGSLAAVLKQDGHDLHFWHQDMHHWADDKLRTFLDENEFEIGNALHSIFSEGIIKREDLYIVTKLLPDDHGFDEAITAGEFLIIECYRKLDPDSYTDIYNDMYLKRYATALIKKQWGANLSKFNGVAMLGGVTMNGEQIYSQAIEEIDKLEQAIREGAFETPIWGMIG